MIVTNDFQCNVCKSITRIKIQIGWLDKYPIKTKCGKCSISLFGNVNLDPHNGSFSIKFKNTNSINYVVKPDYLIEVSGELLTEKMRPYNEEINPFFSPFIKNGLWNTKLNSGKSARITTRSIEKDWPILKRINELWLKGNHEYLTKEIHKLLDKIQYPADNVLELLKAVHFLNLDFTNSFAEKYLAEITDHIFKELDSMINHKQLVLLALHFESNLNEYEQKIFEITERFIEKFQMFIPIYELDPYSEKIHKERIIEKFGLTMFDFEDIKDFYIDTFEDIGDILNLVVAYNNLKHRADFKKMKENVIKDIVDIKDYKKIRNKGRKLEFIDGQESFDKIFASKVNNRLRNAIGHRSYTYDIDTQRIIYYPSGDSKKGVTESLYLIEFVLECFQLMKSSMGLAEIIYQTRKIIYINQGIKPKTC